MEIGFNTNLLETNIINLAVVVGVLIYFGGGILNETLDTRQDRLRESLQAAEREEQETAKKLEGLSALQEAEKPVVNKINSLRESLEEKRKRLIEVQEADMRRLQSTQAETIRFAEEKCLSELSQRVKIRAMETSRQKLKGFSSFRPKGVSKLKSQEALKMFLK